MCAHRGHPAPTSGDPPVAVDGVERAQCLARRPHRRRRRWIGQGQPGAVGMPPAGQGQGEAGEVGPGDLRLRPGRQPLVLGHRPAPVHHTGAFPSGAAGTLLRRRAGHPYRDERTEPARVVGARDPGQAGVDDDPYPRDGQAGLGERGREHHAPPLGRAEHQVLHCGGQPAVEHRDVLGEVGQPPADRGQLARTGQEHQDIPVGLAPRPADDGSHVLEEPRVHTQPMGRHDRPGRRTPDQLDRVRRAVGSDDRYRLVRAEDGRKPLGLGGRRGGDEAHVGAQGGAHVDEESEREVGVEVAFVALIEDDGGHAGEVGIVLEPLDEQPGGDDFDASGRASAPLPAYRVADRGADLLADQRGHPTRRGSCGNPSRLGDNNPAAQPPSEGKGQQGGLARAGRRDEHRRAAPINLVEQRRQDRPNRKGRQTQQIRQDLRVGIGGHRASLPYRAAAAYQHDQVSHRLAGAHLPAAARRHRGDVLGQGKGFTVAPLGTPPRRCPCSPPRGRLVSRQLPRRRRRGHRLLDEHPEPDVP